MGEQLSSRERWLLALRLQPLDRLPFWAKLNGSYARAQAAPFAQMALPDLHEWMGSEPQGGVGACLRERRTCTDSRTTDGGGVRLIEYLTPHGTLRGAFQFDHGSQSWHPREFPIGSLQDLKIMTAWFDDLQVEPDSGALEAARAVSARSEACLAATIGTSPMMDYLQHLAGIERGQYLLADHPAEVRELFEAMHRVLLRKAALVCETSPADLIYMGENTSTTLLSPAQFREYCLPHLREYAAMAAAHDRLMALHMCGTLKALLPDLDTLPVAAFEAFTSPTVGNTTLFDGRAACPGKCLIGGTNAALWTQPASAVIAQLERDLAVLPHHRGLILSSAGVMPPRATPETIRAVVEWIRGFPPRW